MNYKFKYTDKIVGLFIVLSIVLLLFSIIFILVNQKLFMKKFIFTSQFNDANGLKINKDILLKGFKIGKITELQLNKNNLVDIRFFIFEEFIDRIRENSVLNKASNPITGSTIVFIPNYNTNRIADEFSFIPSLDTDIGQFLLKSNQIEKQADAISNIISTVESLLLSLNKDKNAGDNAIARILVNSGDVVEGIKAEIVSLHDILNNFKELSYDMKDPDGLVMKLVDPNGEYMFNSIRGSLNNLEAIMKELLKFTQFINTQSSEIETLLLNSKNAMEQVIDVIEGIKNNPLIKYGIENKKEQETLNESLREIEF